MTAAKWLDTSPHTFTPGLAPGWWHSFLDPSNKSRPRFGFSLQDLPCIWECEHVCTCMFMCAYVRESVCRNRGREEGLPTSQFFPLMSSTSQVSAGLKGNAHSLRRCLRRQEGARVPTVASSWLHLPGLFPSPWQSLGPVRWSDHSWSPTLRTRWKQENLGKEFGFTKNSCSIDPVTYRSSQQSAMHHMGSSDPCHHFGWFACSARSPWTHRGLRELGVLWFRCRLLEISDLHGDDMIKKLPPPWERVTVGTHNTRSL